MGGVISRLSTYGLGSTRHGRPPKRPTIGLGQYTKDEQKARLALLVESMRTHPGLTTWLSVMMLQKLHFEAYYETEIRAALHELVVARHIEKKRHGCRLFYRRAK